MTNIKYNATFQTCFETGKVISWKRMDCFYYAFIFYFHICFFTLKAWLIKNTLMKNIGLLAHFDSNIKL